MSWKRKNSAALILTIKIHNLRHCLMTKTTIAHYLEGHRGGAKVKEKAGSSNLLKNSDYPASLIARGPGTTSTPAACAGQINLPLHINLSQHRCWEEKDWAIVRWIIDKYQSHGPHFWSKRRGRGWSWGRWMEGQVYGSDRSSSPHLRLTNPSMLAYVLFFYVFSLPLFRTS